MYGSQNGIAYSNFGNDGLKWEAQTKIDFGFDLGLKNNKYNLSAAYWIQDNDDIILQAPTAPSLGVPGNFVNRNIGRVKSSGIELTLDAAVINTGNFKWSSSLNFSTQKNEVLSLVNGQDIIGSYNIIREGESIRAMVIQYTRHITGMLMEQSQKPSWFRVISKIKLIMFITKLILLS